jgi:hypothetical protein
MSPHAQVCHPLVIRLALLLIAGTSALSHAAPPLVTEDAGTLAPGACQLEFEQRSFRKSTERDVLPSCNLLFNTEIQLAYLHRRIDEAASEKRWLLQVKKTLWESEKDGLALGLAVGTIKRSGAAERQDYLTLPLTGTVDSTTWSLNLGTLRNSEERKWKATWAGAVEHDLTEKLTLVGEVFGARGESATTQTGLRYWVVAKKVQLTASLGQQRDAGRDGRWTSIGIRFETE